MRGLYIHIPFCKHICNYCDFPKHIASKDEEIDKYIDFIINDIDNYKLFFNSVKTIFIGGGTPNILSNKNLIKLLTKINNTFKNVIEFTIEANPEFITDEQAKIFKKYNINRVSLGVETFNNDDLIKLNRHHTKEDAIDAINILRNNGLKNINIDLIFAHPYDTIDKVKNNIDIIKNLDLNHISYYSMILEEKTVFNHMLKTNKLKLIDEDTEALMYETVIDELKALGYHHYETSNFAKEGFESKHNLLYWNSCEYIGIGAGASGYLDSVRYTNSFGMKKYYEGVKITEKISLEEKKKEFLMLGFRKIDGIKISDYQKRFDSNIFEDFNFDKLLKKKLINISDDVISLTKQGIMLANEVFMEFV